MLIGLISCSKAKLPQAAAARDLYAPSALFRGAMNALNGRADAVYVLSAKFGLVPLNQIVPPYKQTLKDLPSPQRARWAQAVLADLQARHGAALRGSTVEFHAGLAYRQPLESLLQAAGAVCTCPVAGLRQGERLAFYRGAGQRRSSPASPGVPATIHPTAMYRRELAAGGAPQPEARKGSAIPFAQVWARISTCAGQTFRQVRGGEFTYRVTGRTLYPDRTHQGLPYAHFESAFALVPFRNTRDVQLFRGPSYIYAILMDPRIRQADW